MWFFYALAFALITSFSVLVAKRVMKDIDEYLYLSLSNLIAIPFLFLIVVYFYQIPRVDEIFLRSIVISSSIGVIAAVLAYRAIRISDISLISPISAFNPVFTGAISFVVLGETLSNINILGILLICAGAYLLELSRAKKGLLSPIKTLARHKGVQLSLVAYLIWAITPIFEKTAIMHTVPQVPPFVSLVGLSISAVVFSALALNKSGINPTTATMMRKLSPLFLAIGILSGLGQTTAMVAFSGGNLGEVTAVFKLSMIFTVVLGWMFFKEKNIKERLLGSTIMLSGIILLVT